MKRLILVLCAAVACRLEASSFISVGGVKLYRALPPPESGVELREYLPIGETYGSWTRSASVRVYKDLHEDPKAFLTKMAATVAKSHPKAFSTLIENDKSKGLILNFVLFPPASDPNPFAEWSVMRAEYAAGKGFVVYQYGMRVHGLGKETAAILDAERLRMTGPFDAASFEEEPDG
jgi:hypothetical protein